LEVIVFPNVYERYSSLIAEDRIIGVKGKLNFKEDELPKIIADTIFDVKESDMASTKKTVKIRIPDRGTQMEDLETIKGILTLHRGDTPVLIYTSEGKVLKTQSDLWVDANGDFQEAVTRVIGERNLKIQ
jgi:DNA polymerase III subunit alpha